MSATTDIRTDLAAIVREADWRPAEQRAIANRVLANTYPETAGLPVDMRETIAAQLRAGADALEAEGRKAAAILAARAAAATPTHRLPYIR